MFGWAVKEVARAHKAAPLLHFPLMVGRAAAFLAFLGALSVVLQMMWHPIAGHVRGSLSMSDASCALFTEADLMVPHTLLEELKPSARAIVQAIGPARPLFQQVTAKLRALFSEEPSPPIVDHHCAASTFPCVLTPPSYHPPGGLFAAPCPRHHCSAPGRFSHGSEALVGLCSPAGALSRGLERAGRKGCGTSRWVEHSEACGALGAPAVSGAAPGAGRSVTSRARRVAAGRGCRGSLFCSRQPGSACIGWTCVACFLSYVELRQNATKLPLTQPVYRDRYTLLFFVCAPIFHQILILVQDRLGVKIVEEPGTHDPLFLVGNAHDLWRLCAWIEANAGGSSDNANKDDLPAWVNAYSQSEAGVSAHTRVVPAPGEGSAFVALGTSTDDAELCRGACARWAEVARQGFLRQLARGSGEREAAGQGSVLGSPPTPTPADNQAQARRDQVVGAVRHAWQGYWAHARGYDMLKPTSKQGEDWLFAQVATLILSMLQRMKLPLFTVCVFFVFRVFFCCRIFY